MITGGRRWCSGAVLADHLAAIVAGQSAAVLDQKAAGAGELVGLAWQHLHGQLLTGQVRSRKFDRPVLALVQFDQADGALGAACLELLDAVLGQVVIGLTRAAVVCGQGSSRRVGRAVVLALNCGFLISGADGCLFTQSLSRWVGVRGWGGGSWWC